MPTNAQCSCCEHWTLNTAGGFETCPVCGWVDHGDDSTDGRRALIRSRIAVAETGAAEGVNPRDVRRPLSTEVNPSAAHILLAEQQLRDRQRHAVEESINRAFAEVTKGDRVALADALRRDLGVDIVDGWDGRDERWTDLPTDVLDRYASRGSQMFFFGNEQSFRYYLPAFMLRATRAYARTALSALGMGGAAAGGGSRVAHLLSEPQRESVRVLLEFLSVYGPDHEDAARMAKRWAKPSSSRE
jgi:hypothetical protein